MKKLVLLVLMLLVFPIKANAVEKIYDIPLDKDLQHFVVLECEKANISPEFILAVMEVETQYGALGTHTNIMQIQEKFYKEEMEFLGITEIRTPENNIMLGIKVFHDLFAEYEDVGHVLMIWNGGKDYADDLIAKGISETKFCKKVYKAQENIYASLK